MTHNDLLLAYVRSKLTVIAERSADIEADARELRAQARVYADENGLTLHEGAFDAYIAGDDAVRAMS